MTDQLKKRTEELRSRGATNDQVEALLAYNTNVFQPPDSALRLPMPDEEFAKQWDLYASDMRESGTLRSLENYLVQLRFPVRVGISQSQEYLDVTQRGKLGWRDREWEGLGLSSPQSCALEVYSTPAGRIGTITPAVRGDFVLLVQAFGYKNEPITIPPSMGALMVAGYRNWHRVTQIMERNDAISSQRRLADRSSYQDRFILLSRGNYSGVKAEQLGLSEEEWSHTSWIIRREHEAAHYFTRRVLQSMRNNIFDELLADYCGIVRACGRFRAEWLLHFLGLEMYPRYRAGGRLENYRGPTLDDGAFDILRNLVYDAVLSLESFDRELRREGVTQVDWPTSILTLNRFCLEELAGTSAVPMLLATHNSLRSLTFSCPAS